MCELLTGPVDRLVGEVLLIGDRRYHVVRIHDNPDRTVRLQSTRGERLDLPLTLVRENIKHGVFQY